MPPSYSRSIEYRAMMWFVRPSVCLSRFLILPVRWRYALVAVSNTFERGSMVGYDHIQILSAGGSISRRCTCFFSVIVVIYKEVKFSHTRYRALRRPGANLGVQAISPQMTVSHPPGGRLPLFSTRPAVTFLAEEHYCPDQPVPNYTAW